MNYEKKYKEALKDMRAIYPNLKGDAKLAVEHAFPELRESEDERIREELVNFILYKAGHLLDEETEHKFAAYLEKQKEPIDPFDTKLFQDGVKEGRRLEREDIVKEQQSAEWSEDKFPKDIEKDATQFCFDKGFNITPYQAKEIATHYLIIGYNFGYVEGRKNAHIPAKELGLPSSMDFKQEWSDEDEKMRRNLMSLLANMRGDRITEETYQKYYPWLKSLRPSWKPSEVCYGAKGDPDPAGVWKPSEKQPQVADASKMEQPEGGFSEKPNDLLSEAAKDSWAVYEYRESPRGLYSTCYVDGFKAGAEWMARLGITVECGVRVYPTLDEEPHPWVSLYRYGIDCDSIADIPELETLGFKDGDNAIVTIRKK